MVAVGTISPPRRRGICRGGCGDGDDTASHMHRFETVRVVALGHRVCVCIRTCVLDNWAQAEVEESDGDIGGDRRKVTNLGWHPLSSVPS